MKSICTTILILSIFISACATRYPANREKQATYHTKMAESLFLKGDCDMAGKQIYEALFRQTGDLKVKQLFIDNPKIKECYVLHWKKEAANISSEYEAVPMLKNLTDVEVKKILPKKQINELRTCLSNAILDCNKTGKIPFILGDRLDRFPELNSSEPQKIIIDRTISNLQNNNNDENRPIVPLMEYVDRVGVDSIEGRKIEALLPTMNIRRDELDIVKRVFPVFALNREKDIIVKIFIQVKNGDRLFEDDLLEALKAKINGVDWVPSLADPNTLALTIEQVRNNEKILPEQTQTITYAHHEVNLMGAVLMMPRNASYLYDVTSGGSEIEYGYVLSVIANSKEVYDKVIRGKVDNNYSHCQNARIQNVFGGVSPAKFVANNDMAFRCNGHNSVSIEDLRKEVLLKIADEILKVPRIKAVHELN